MEGRLAERELAEWMAYARIEPWGEERADLRMAILAAAVANFSQWKRRDGKPWQPSEFLPRLGRHPDEQEIDHRSVAEGIKAMFEAIDVKPAGPNDN